MPEAINLIPQEEKVEQYTAQAVKTSTVFAFLLLVIVGAVSGFLFYRINSLKSSIKSTDASINQTRGKIASMEGIEIIARNLDARAKALTEIFDTRVIYSKLLQELKAKSPESIAFVELVINGDNTLTLSGTAENYLAIANYMKNITDASEMFTSVTLNSVNLEESTQKAEFLITVGFDPSAFK